VKSLSALIGGLRRPSAVQARDFFEFMSKPGECAPLRTRAEYEAAGRAVRALGVYPHHDPRKDWDTVKCLSHILRSVGTGEAVLDVGSSLHGVFLRGLERLGYRKLYACDLRDAGTWRYRATSIQFSVQDLTKTTYPDGFFSAVTSISVIEHGAPLEAYVKEMSRILRPGGLLLTTTDFWSEPVDCRGIRPYGPSMPEMKVFTPAEIEDFRRLAESAGFELCGPLDLKTQDRVIHWERVDRRYTFLFLAMRRRA
jgi:SAM-dependent methyltransferase